MATTVGAALLLSTSVQLGHNRLHGLPEFLRLGIDFLFLGKGVGVHPAKGLIASVLGPLLVVAAQLAAVLVQGLFDLKFEK